MNKLLIADDNPAIRDLLRASLKSYASDISIAYDGRSALRKVTIVNPDLLILDLEMPDMSGLDVLEKIRQQSEFENMKVMILTAENNPYQDARAKLADVVVLKPFNLRELIDIVQNLLSQTSNYVIV